MCPYEEHKHSVTNENMHLSAHTQKKQQKKNTHTVTIIHYVLLDMLHLFIDCASFKGQSVYLIPSQCKPLLPISTSDTDDTSL